MKIMSNLTKLYIAIPYSGFEHKSYQYVNRVTADLISKGYNAFSPITHSHPLSELLDFQPTWDYWQYIDYQYIDWADELVLVVLQEKGMSLIRESVGVQAEIQYALKYNKLIRVYDYQLGDFIEANLDQFIANKKLVE